MKTNKKFWKYKTLIIERDENKVYLQRVMKAIRISMFPKWKMSAITM